jgi:hypothetical protein
MHSSVIEIVQGQAAKAIFRTKLARTYGRNWSVSFFGVHPEKVSWV